MTTIQVCKSSLGTQDERQFVSLSLVQKKKERKKCLLEYSCRFACTHSFIHTYRMSSSSYSVSACSSHSLTVFCVCVSWCRFFSLFLALHLVFFSCSRFSFHRRWMDGRRIDELIRLRSSFEPTRWRTTTKTSESVTNACFSTLLFLLISVPGEVLCRRRPWDVSAVFRHRHSFVSFWKSAKANRRIKGSPGNENNG